ncbi:hypothetical protein TRFO_42274 [Tritrichomonas foetus]|uniref:Uncharacterized protein n=1 Tax=Tritrichomonas foetus TaxID=1144522 RepID=A0A1J4KX40_9EUKA|nr:hypothetical protein TRFO_42274 [Tritrichomonas foetus]|eukprot:OHT15819.1 hypothetical protein TRFO_42274 [Tritrichomonas foetus]
MKVTISVIEVTDIFKPDGPTDSSVYCTVKHTPSNFLVRSEQFQIENNTLKLSHEHQTFSLPVETLTEPVVISLYNSKEEEIAYLILSLTDFSDGKETDKTFDFLPLEGYSDNCKIHLKIKIDVKTDSKEAAAPAQQQTTPQTQQQTTQQQNENAEEEGDELTEEKKALKTKEERNREKATKLGQNYEEIYEAAKEGAQARYQQILNECAAILVENENWVNGENQEEEQAQESKDGNGKRVDPALDSSDSDL